MKVTCKCDCGAHIITFDYDCVQEQNGLSICVYDLFGGKGRRLKKPKLTSDVVLIGSEIKKLIKFVGKMDLPLDKE